MNKKRLQKIVLPVAILGVGLGVGRGLMALAPEAERRPSEPPPRVVEVMPLEPTTTAVRIHGTGTVEAAQVVDVVPEVSGRIVWRAEKLMPGGRFVAGEALARVEKREYALAVDEERARVRSAELELELEKGRGEVAAREWQLLKGDDAGTNNALALRTSQLETAQVSLEAARSGLARAQLNLERTVLRAPFNATVVTESIDVGQRVGPNGSVAKLLGTDAFWVRVGVRVEDLRSIDVPGFNGERASLVTVTQRLTDGSALRRQGRVLRLVENLDAQTRRAQLLVSIPEPLRPGDDGLPLLPGAYVEVEIEGRTIEGVASVPAAAVYEGRTVWVVENGLLQRRAVDVKFSSGDQAFIIGDFSGGLPVVTTRLSTPVTGMPVVAETQVTASKE